MTNSLSLRFNVSAATIVTLILVIFGTYDYLSASKELNKQLRSEISFIATSIDKTAASSVWDFDKDLARTAITAMLSSENVEAILIYDNQQTTFLGMAKQADSGEIVEVEEFSWEGQSQTQKLVYEEDEQKHDVGELVIFINDSAVTAALNRAIWTALMKIVLLDLFLILSLTVLVNRLVVSPIMEISHALKDIASGEGDLTQRLSSQSKGEIGDLAKFFNVFVEKIHTSIKQVHESTQHMNASIAVSQESSQNNLSHSSQQLVEIDQVATAITELNQTALEVAGHAVEAAQAADSANHESSNTQEIMKQTSNAMSSLAEELVQGYEVMSSLQGHVGDIVTVLEVIRGIAEQTNLLALNAAIEAARAGEQGRGFSVVADEVRALAGRTQQSTSEIQVMIESLQAGSEKAVNTMQHCQEAGEQTVGMAMEASNALQQINSAIQQMNNLNTHIATAAEEQSKVTEEVNRNVNNMVALTHKADDSSKESVAASENLNKESDVLSSLVGQFKV